MAESRLPCNTRCDTMHQMNRSHAADEADSHGSADARSDKLDQRMSVMIERPGGNERLEGIQARIAWLAQGLTARPFSTAPIGDKLKVFISSDMLELYDVREFVARNLIERGIDAWIHEARAGARPESVIETSLRETEIADIYVGLFWRKYGEVTVQVPAAIATDAAGNPNTASGILSWTVDSTAPSVTLASSASDPVAGAFTVSVTFDEAVTGFALDDRLEADLGDAPPAPLPALESPAEAEDLDPAPDVVHVERERRFRLAPDDQRRRPVRARRRRGNTWERYR